MMWILFALVFTGIVLLADYLSRRKKWNENTAAEKAGLVLTALFSIPYVFCSVYGALFGLAGTYGDGPFQKAIHTAVVTGGIGTFFVCLTATIASLVLRKRGKANASSLALIIGFAYCVLITVASLILG